MRLTLPTARNASGAAALLASSAVLVFAPASHAAPGQSRSCSPGVRTAVLPPWARSGFSEPQPRSAQALGQSGEILAIPFSDHLQSPPAKGVSNKILWVSRLPVGPGSNLRIAAQRMVGTAKIGAPVARIVLGGPGPSIINVPFPGCWRVSLHWSGHSYSVDLRYEAHAS